MDAQHELMRGIWGGDFVSPIKEDLIIGGLRVLDVGCGSGTWLLQLARDYPMNHYTGIDMSPVFPTNTDLQNVEFVQADVLQGIPFDADSFDFVHIRFLNTAFTEQQWEEKVIPEVTRVTKPKRWLELCEFDIDGQSFGPASRRMVTTLTSYLASKGINGLISEEISEFLESMETLETVYTEERFSGLGKWAGHLGDLAIKSFVSAFRGMRELPGWMGIEEEEYNEMVNKYSREVEDVRVPSAWYPWSQMLFKEYVSFAVRSRSNRQMNRRNEGLPQHIHEPVPKSQNALLRESIVIGFHFST
ncbi:15997_t:CDS:2 [Acaulospora colombiana]|uniref:15997_t:CDS:1 n=1 Tax=Acaulospora colombiana TaxID=27376 RepID=A0ACA9LA56_9GLOM|nr:15997_t:CDS:2 [Acaulospora colombiana]